MIVRNWMQPNPMLVGSDMLVAEAKDIIMERKQPGLAVVDGGRLRGLLTQAHCLRAGHFVTRTQNPDELNYFVTRVKVKDIMVRNPATIQACDTMEDCLAKGRALGVSQFPVLEDGRVVGMISANEIFSLAIHLLGAWEKRSGLTVAPLTLGPGVLGRIVDVAEGAGAELQAVYPMTRHSAHGEEDGAKRVIIRFHAADVHAVADALVAKGIAVLEPLAAHERRAAPLPRS
jgi:acetoin utilization protein AcuB